MHSQISQKSRKYPEKFRKIPKHILHTCIEKSRDFQFSFFFSIFSLGLFQPENLETPKIPRRMINKIFAIKKCAGEVSSDRFIYEDPKIVQRLGKN